MDFGARFAAASNAAVGPEMGRPVEIGLGVQPARRSDRGLIPALEPSEQAIDLEQGQERDEPARQEPQEQKSKHVATMAAGMQPGGHRSTLHGCRSLATLGSAIGDGALHFAR